MMENLIYRNRMEANQFTDQLEDELDDQVIQIATNLNENEEIEEEKRN